MKSKKQKRFQAQMMINGRRIYLGYYPTKYEVNKVKDFVEEEFFSPYYQYSDEELDEIMPRILKRLGVKSKRKYSEHPKQSKHTDDLS